MKGDATRRFKQGEYLQQAKQTKDWRNVAKKADEQMAKLMVEKHARKNIYKTCNPGEKVFVKIVGIFRPPQTLREEIGNYSISVESINGEVARDFSNIPWDDYIQQMDLESTYGDERTLRAFANIFNIEIEIVSTLSNDGRVSINPENSNPLGQITLGHFAESQSDHYVCLQREIAEDDETQQQDLNEIADNTVQNNSEEIVQIRDVAKEVARLEALPIEIIEKVVLCLTTSSFEFPNHVCWTYNNAINAL